MQRILPPPVAKLCLALLCLVLLMNTTTAAAQTQEADDQGWSYPTSKPATPFGGGSGSQNDPYLITKAQHLANLSYMINNGEKYKGMYFRMTRDIVLNEGVMSEDGKFNEDNANNYTEWTTMGFDDIYMNKQFHGFFDGDGHTIYGIYQSNKVENVSRRWYGFFHRLDEAIISNLTISHSYICSNARVSNDMRGIFCCAAANSTISNCHVKNSYLHELTQSMPYDGLGGLLGRGYETEIRDCSFNGTIEVDANTTTAEMGTGGLVGNTVSCKIADCKASGNIIINKSKGFDGKGHVKVGGIFGFGFGDETVSRCLNTMDIVVHHENSTDEMCDIYVGGIGGQVEVEAHHVFSISQCVNLGNIIVGASGETFNMKERLMMLSGIANFYQNISITFASQVNVADCANYGNIRLKAGSITSEKSDEKLLAAGCCALYTTWNGTLNSNWKRCINVSNGNDMTAGGLTMRYAPIMGIMDRPDDAEYIKMEKPCYYNTNISNVLNPVSSVSDTKLELFYHKTPFALTATTPSWTFLTDKESTTWAGYAVPYTPFFTKTSLLGSGTETDPYLITNEKELLMLNTFMGNKDNAGDARYDKYFRLMNDLDMTNMGTFPTIVNGMDYTKGFTGTFDGNGHYINGLRVSGEAMFKRIGTGGVVKNLMLTNFRGNEADNLNSSIAGFHFGTIEDCSVFGTISSRLSQTYETEVTAAGIARSVHEGGVIRRCMFKGTLKASPKTSAGETNTTLSITGRMSGIAHYVDGTVEQCYASFEIETENGFKGYVYKQGIGSTSKTQGSGVTPVIRNCAYVCAETNTTVEGAKQCDSEADITLDLLGDTGSKNWLKGAFRPVNKHTKHLTVTDAAGQTTDLDLCPDDAWTLNKVYNLTLTDANADDRVLQQFKNLALYNPQNKTAYIINLELDRSLSSFDYKPLEGCTATKGATRITLKQKDALAGAPGHYLLCLPCPLRTADLPAGSEIHGLGYNAANEENTNQYVFYLTECDSVGAGVPCHVYIPDCVSGDFTLLSYGNIVTKPQGTAKYGPQGYFTPTPISKAFTGITVKSDTNTPEYLTYTEGSTEMKLFSAAATSEKRTDNQWLSTRRIIDENDPYLAETIKSLNGQTKTNLYLKRKLWGNEWNTLTLPFDIEVKTFEGKADRNVSMQAQELQSVSTDANGGLTLTFAVVTELKAGYPYLVKPTTDCETFDLSNAWLDIKAEANIVTQSDGKNEVSMIPYYVPRVLVAGDYFLMNDKFYVVAEGMNVPSLGMRAHFTANAAASAAMQSARLVFDNGDVTGIDGIARPAAATNGAVYDLSGRRVEKPAHGLYIVNGRKVLLP